MNNINKIFMEALDISELIKNLAYRKQPEGV